MKMKHKVKISISNGKEKKTVLGSGVKRIPYRLFKALFGECSEVLLLNRGETVQSIEIHEVRDRGVEGGNR